MKILIKEGRVIDPANNLDKVADVLIEDGKIKKIGRLEDRKTERQKDLEIIEAKDKIVCPGFIDVHTHLREPGFEYKETIATGTRSAAKGGFTTIFCMPNTNPVCDNRAVVEFILKKVKEEGVISVLPVGAITKNLEGKELAEIGEMKSAGIIALSDDGKCVQNSEVMRRAMEYANMFDLPIICHCEDENLSKNGVMNEGYYSTILGLRGISSEAESIMVERDIQLAELTGCPIHITHISCSKSVELVRRAKERGVKVTADVTPHHLILTDECLQSYDTNLKVNPPLRTKKDIETLIEGLIEGTIDCIATDNAPHTIEEKEVEFDYAPSGMVGLETAVSLVISELGNKGLVDIKNLIAKFTINPAKIFNLNKGTLSIGADADITIIDPDLEWEVDVNKFLSRSKNSPFHQWRLKGRVIATIRAGEIIG